MIGDDRDLYESFAAVRREEEAHVPPISIFSLTAPERGRRRLPGKVVAAAACLATVITAAAWLLPGARIPHEGLNRGRGQSVASITTWRPATDFLLDTPGRELLQGVPAIGERHGVVTALEPGEGHRHFSQQALP